MNMNIAQHLLWFTTNTVLVIMLVRAIFTKLFETYVIFFLYLSHVLVLGILRMYVYFFRTPAYTTTYWYTEFVYVALGYCVIWEMYRQILADFPGTLRVARVTVSGLFAIVVMKMITSAIYMRTWSVVASVEDLERNVRTVQIALLMVLIGLLTYYAIPVGRNTRGMIQGYGVYVGASVIELALRSYYGPAVWLWWQYLQPVMYLIAVSIWAVTLWSFASNPKPDKAIDLEVDYDLLTQRTVSALAKARNHILRAVRP